MGADISQFDFVELSSSFRGNLGISSGSIVKEYRIPWDQMPAFVTALRGGWQLVDENTWNYRTAHQLRGTWTNYYAAEIDFTSFGKGYVESTDDGIPLDDQRDNSYWEYSTITVTYKIPRFDYSMDPNSIMEESIDFDSEVLLINGGSYKFAGTSRFYDPPIARQTPILSYNLKLINRPGYPMGGPIPLGLKLGMLNSKNFKGAPEKCVMFNGAKSNRSFVAADHPLGWTFELNFRIKPFPWDWFWDDVTSAFHPVVPLSDDGDPIFEEFDMNELLMNRWGRFGGNF
jgi:hypothetical protein